FDTPRDKLIWDVGHQAYPHKIVTGRRDRIRTLSQGGGLSGFTRRSESEYDPFGAAHSSTSISSALGFAIASKLSGDSAHAIAVIGDGALSAGMAYEAMNNAAAAGNRLIVILNDNDMSIAPPVGSLRNALARLVSSGKYLTPRKLAQKLARAMPEPLHVAARRMEEYARGLITGRTGLDKVAEAFPDRTFDVGIAEQHAVTFAAGLAAQGYRPFATIYSTFLQRAYDQVVHDVAIQNLPVRFAMDRAGLVGADGATHA